MEAGQRPQRAQCSIEHIWGALVWWEAGCLRQDAGGRRLEERGWRQEARGWRLEPEARGWRPEAGRGGGLDGHTDGRMDVIRKQLDVICAECIVRPSKYMRKVINLFFLRDKKVHFFGPRDNFGEILGDESLARALRKISSRQI